MTGRLGAARALVIGLVLAAAVVAALSTLSVAEPRWHRGQAVPDVSQVTEAKEKKRSKSKEVTAPKPKAAGAPKAKKRSKAKAVAAPKDKKGAKTKAVSQPTTCSFPWSYSRALRHCICINDGYTLQGGKCVRDLTTVSCRDDERWSPKRGACVCDKGLKRQGDACVVAEPVQIVVTPPPPEEPPSLDAVFPVAPPDVIAAPTDVAAPPPDEVPSAETAAKTADEQDFYKD